MIVRFSAHGSLKLARFLGALAWLCSGLGPAFAQDAGTNNFATGPAPKWVVPNEASVTDASAESSDTQGEYYLLVDRQLNAATEESFVHIVRKVTSQNGVQNGGSVQFYFDPAFQNLTVHFVRIIRDGQVINKLDKQKFKVIQQETELERHMFNGTLSAVLFLEDVRIGDIIEYASTVKGANPILKGHFANSFLLDWAVPVRHQVCRLLWPSARKLTVKNHNTSLQPSVQESGGIREYVWEQHDAPAVLQEDETPFWYESYGWIQFTEFSSWQEVAEWARPLYAPDKHGLSEGLRQKIALWRTASNPEKVVENVLRFVQDEVRYLGIEIGANSHQPNDSEVVFARRFGDCKDKVHLFCTILDQLGIEAHPVLVHSYLERMVDQWAPSPYAFNHVVAEVKLGGVTIWLDPTLSYQRGALTDRYFPDYARGLVIEAGTRSLTTIPQQENRSLTTRHLTFQINNYTNPATWEIVTVRQGADADGMRADIAETSREELEKFYLNHRARLYPKITTASPLRIRDDEQANVLTVTENYALADMWELAQDKQKWSTTFYAEEIYRVAEKPNTSLRSQPLAVGYPQHLKQTTRVFLPEDYTISNQTNDMADAAVRVERTVSYSGRQLVINYDYEALANVVPVPDVPEHLNVLKGIRESTAFGIEHANGNRPELPSQPNWTVVALGVIYLVVVTIAAVVIYRYRPVNPNPPVINYQLDGISGWLIILMLVLVAKPFALGRLIINQMPVYSLTRWNLLTTPGGAHYNAAYAPVLLFDLLGNISLFVFSLLLLVLFFRKRFTFPRMLISYVWLGLGITLVSHILNAAFFATSATPKNSAAQFFGGILGTFIWTAYMLNSQRVKVTFVR